MLLHKLRLKCFLVLQSDSQENRNEENLIFYCKYFIPLWTVKCWLLSPTFKQCELVHFHFFFLLSSEEQTVRWATRAIGTNTPALLCNVLKPGGVWTHLVCLCGSIIPFLYDFVLLMFIIVATWLHFLVTFLENLTCIRELPTKFSSFRAFIYWEAFVCKNKTSVHM